MSKANKKTEEESVEVAKEAAPSAPQKKSEPNVIYIGKKGVMAYVLSAVLQLSQSSFVVLKSRGRAISKAVDVSQVLINRFGDGKYYVKEVNLGTETLQAPDGTSRNVSTIDIVVSKKA